MAIVGKQAIALARLVAGDDQGQAAEAAGVARSTVARWLNDADFAQALEAGSASIMTAARESLAASLIDAVRVTRQVLLDDNEATYHRLAAARMVFDAVNRNKDIYATAEDTKIVITWADGQSWRDGVNWEDGQWGQGLNTLTGGEDDNS